ncbi:MAG: ribonuclease J [Bacilli bacterium]|nr:ribonuclease J [Bacilli bacterium]MBN2876066.1 ribonuclease J [Bacilli bacterium]
MSQIKFFALGGLGDNGKNLYVLEINEKLIVLDAGLQHPSGDLLGVDAIVPDISYLVSRKEDIIGIFLSHAHDKNIGALPMILSQINTKVYGTSFTVEVARDFLADNKMNHYDYDFEVVKYNTIIKFDDFAVEYFQTTHSVPLSAGIVIYTEDGAIVYASDFTFDQNVTTYYKTDFRKLAKIADYGVFALLCESSGAGNVGHSNTSQNLKHIIRTSFTEAKGRIIVGMYSTELSNIQIIIDEALKANKKISIIGRKAQRLVNIGERMGYIEIPEESLVNLKFIDSDNKNEFNDVVFLVTGERHEPFFMLQRMAKGYDRLISLIESDTVMFMCPPLIGTEKIAAKTYNVLCKLGVNMIKIDKTMLSRFHASSEDIKFMYSMLNPKYVIPINGEYRYQLAQYEIAKEYGYKESEILLLDNGEVISFNHGIKDKFHDMVENGTLLVDGTFETDINDKVIKERELLSQDGFLMLIANINAKLQLMLNKPEIVSRGFMFMKENEEMIKEIEIIYQLETNKQFAKANIDWKEYKDNIRYQIQRYLYNKTKRKPIVIPVIIDTDKESVCEII